MVEGPADVDLCVHDVGESRYAVDLRECERCGYAAPRAWFADPLDPAHVERVRVVLARRRAETSTADGAGPEAALARLRRRSAVALELCDATGRSPADVWTLTLNCAWAERCEGARAVASTAGAGELAAAWNRAGDEAGAELVVTAAVGGAESPGPFAASALERWATEESDAPAPDVRRLYAAWRARRCGENEPALRLTRALDDAADGAVRELGRRLEESIRIERDLQARLVELPPPSPPPTARWRGVGEFQRAEVLRRMGRLGEARRHYADAVELGLPLAQIEFARQALGAVDPADAQAAEAALAREVAAMAESVAVPDDRSAAAEGSWLVRSDLLVPALAARLSSADARVREAALRRLRWLRVRDARDIAAIAERAMHDPVPAVRRAALGALARCPAERVRAPVEALLADDDAGLRNRAAAVLGGVGDERSFARLLETAGRIDESTLLCATSQLANRAFGGDGDLRAWWGSVGSRTSRDEWVLGGFETADAGWPVRDASSPEARLVRATELLEDERFHIRANALRLLREAAPTFDPWPDAARGEDPTGTVWADLRRAWSAHRERAARALPSSR